MKQLDEAFRRRLNVRQAQDDNSPAHPLPPHESGRMADRLHLGAMGVAHGLDFRHADFGHAPVRGRR